MSNAVDEFILDEPDVVSAFLLPIEKHTLMVPMAAVAEVTNYDMTVLPLAKQDDRFYGWITWRDQQLPLFSFEGLLDETPLPLTPQSRVVIFNAIGAAEHRGFYGLVVQGYPQRVNILDTDDARSTLEPSDVSCLLYEIEVAKQSALIPDFEYLEALSMELPRPDAIRSQ